MRRTFGVFAAAAFLAACRPVSPPTFPPAISTAKVAAAGPRTPTAPRDPGARAFAELCTPCHGEPGKAVPRGRANDLGNQDFLSAATDSFLRAAVERGRPGTEMPAYRGEEPILTAEEVHAVVQYIRAGQTEPTVDMSDTSVRGDPKLGKKLYASRCAGCHGSLGQGATALSLNNPVFLETVSDGFLRHAIAYGRRDTPMEAYGNKLSAQQIDHLVTLIRSWSPTSGPLPSDS